MRGSGASTRPGGPPRIIANINDLWPVIEADATARPTRSLALALEWHRRIYDRVTVSHPDYVGQVRDSDPRFPCLVDYEVAVGTARGLSDFHPALTVAAAVPGGIAVYFAALRVLGLEERRLITGGRF